jgi:cation diffusion facilitator CzcD-associated flavoprotein CzcO
MQAAMQDTQVDMTNEAIADTMRDARCDARVDTASLAALEARVTQDLAMIGHPDKAWMTPRTGPDGRPALDVLIVGAGQSGCATAFGLMRSRVDNILVVDAAAEGLEGPWLNYARMQTLRHPKHFTGPDLEIPSLTLQAWYSACFGAQAWQSLGFLPKELWVEYLLWVRRMTRVPVQNETRLLSLGPAPDGELLQAELESREGRRTVYARKVVLATGQEGVGRWSRPAALDGLPADRCLTTADPFDFSRVRGRSVAVIGAGASAFDNAATALEAGAASVTLLCRRYQPQLVQPYLWLTFRGFLRHLSELDDAWRWRFMQHILGLREGFPQATYDRCARHPNFRLQSGADLRSAHVDEVSDRIVLDTGAGPFAADFVIAATGIETDLSARPELRACASNVAVWSDRYTPPPDEADARLAAFPYLAHDYAFCEREQGLTPWIRNVHLFAIGSTVSFGASGSSVNAMTTAVPKLVHGLTRSLFVDDVQAHWASLQAYDVAQATLRPPPA